MSRPLQNVLGSLMVLVLGVSAAYSANVSGFRDAFPPPSRNVDSGPIDRDPTTANSSASTTSLRSFPWWAPVATFSGDETTVTESFEIDPFALQWRSGWTCESGSLFVEARRPGGDVIGQPLVDTECPTEGRGFSVETGAFELAVEAEGGWELVVEQQVDVPLVEPPTPQMEKGEVIATGEIYDMDRSGEGTVEVYELDDGTHMLRLEDFYITPNVDLEIDVSELSEPKTTEEFDSAPYEEVTLMPVTTGSINYEIPESVDIMDWRSIVIWCEPLHLAYGGATLEIKR